MVKICRPVAPFSRSLSPTVVYFPFRRTTFDKVSPSPTPPHPHPPCLNSITYISVKNGPKLFRDKQGAGLLGGTGDPPARQVAGVRQPIPRAPESTAPGTFSIRTGNPHRNIDLRAMARRNSSGEQYSFPSEYFMIIPEKRCDDSGLRVEKVAREANGARVLRRVRRMRKILRPSPSFSLWKFISIFSVDVSSERRV